MSSLAAAVIPPTTTSMTLRARSSPENFNTLACNARALVMILAAQAGSAAAFDELQILYSARLFNIILRITKNREDAEDALQNTFLRAYVSLRQFEGRSSVYSWLTRIAINSALMILRRRRARPEASLPCFSELEDFYMQAEVEDPAPDPEQICALRELRENLSFAIQKLKPPLRTPIEIRLDQELSLNELAETLNLTVPAVKGRLFRARSRLARTVMLQKQKEEISRGMQRVRTH